jgi:APA family basic amino acid/polyamine antiporter
MVLYVAVGLVGVASVGAETFAAAGTRRAAPLEVVARQFPIPGAALLVAAGAVSAMLGVLLNLILGLSRVVLAMGRRRDIPSFFSYIAPSTATPFPAVLLVSGLIAGLVLVGDVKTTWSFSAFTVLIYYAITNLAAIRLSDEERLYPRLVPWLGLCSCLFLAFWVEPLIWMIGVGLIAGGLLWFWAARRLAGTAT